ncbi:PKD domain-containing protein [Vibrio sp. S12_S33]|uniref:PKD domain-containing protein n=1 Tax=Vibrio sp. S12_S33 TaxID=2720223 RepID=UPI00177C7015|nr:hydrogenase expression protein [Vibrio sp. S12_S33]MBD1567467.1 hydrogenase expression protein [Vibrio sp. S12_S33]
MKKTAISLMVTTVLMGSPIVSTSALGAAQENVVVATQSESVSTTITVSQVGEWYSQAQVELKNISGLQLDLADAEVWVISDKDATVNSSWGQPGFNVSSPAPNTFVFKHDSNSDALENDQSIQIIFGFSSSNGDYIDGKDVHVEKVVIKNDPVFQGEIMLQAPSSPHVSLAAASVLVEGESYSETVAIPWGGSLLLNHLQDGEYRVTAKDVLSELGFAHASSPASTVTVDSNAMQPSVNVQYDAFVYYASVSLTMPALDGIAGNLTTDVTVKMAGSEEVERSLMVPFGGEVNINKLLDAHKYDLSYSPITVNNVHYQPNDNLDVLVSKEAATEITTNIVETPVTIDDFRKVQVSVVNLPQEAMPIRLNLIAKESTDRYNYEISSSSFILPDDVKPGEYDIQIDSVFVGKSRYVYDGENSISVTPSDAPLLLTLPFYEAMSLAVKGFPDYVANGTVTNDSEQTTSQIGATQINAIFKYAGLSGSGDPGDILEMDKLALHTTYANAQTASDLSGHYVLPVMVVYTVNASGGASWTDLVDNDLLYKHYATFITQAVAAQEYAAGDGSSPMSFILNPDFLGELQKNPRDVENLNKEGAVNVNDQLSRALSYMKTTYGYQPSVLVPQFENTLKGYIESINFIMDGLAEDVTYGWQINLWAVGSANWIHQTEDQSDDKGQEVVNFVNSLDVYTGPYKPDYIVFDKYERDGFGSQAIANYAYNATSWTRYLSYVKSISDGVDSPAMIWQIPGGHMPTQEESNTLINPEHEASGGSYFMGDARIGKDINHVRTGLLDKQLSPATYNGASNVRELLEKDANYDWSRIAIRDLPKSNVFALLWGGGSTTSVVTIGTNDTDNGWLDNKVEAYAQNPVCLAGNDCDGSIWGGEGEDIPPVDNHPPSISLSSNYQVNSGESVTITANAFDPDGDIISYQWSVPSNLIVMSGTNSDTLVVTAPVTDPDLTFTISLDVSDGELRASDSTSLKVIGDNSSGGDSICVDIPEFEQRQYQPGEQVTYQGSLHEATRWTDSMLTPADQYSGWALIGSCS